MRFLKMSGLGLFLIVAGCFGAARRAAADDNVAATWHFAGSAQLTNNPNFDNVKKILTLETSVDFRDLVLDRFSAWLGRSLFSATNDDPASPLRPLLDDLLSAESMSALGGAAPGPLSFIVALRLDDQRAQAWQTALPKLAGGPGQSFKALDFTGQQWKLAEGQTVWSVRAKDWLLIGSGEALRAAQTDYLQKISQNGRPGPALNQSWLEADLDWPQLTRWLPDLPHILLPARTKIAFTAPDHALFMNVQVTYPQAIPWKFDPWRIPTNIIRDPLISFTAGQDVAAYMNPAEPLSKLTDNPLAGQYYVWSLDESMVFQTYGAWPVTEATNTLQRIANEAPAAFNPDLQRIRAGELRWQPQRNSLIWGNLGPLLAPTLQVAPETNGQYLLVSFFPLIHQTKPAPPGLFEQILGRTNIVYYDWEGTGHRLVPWQVLSAILPVLPRIPMPAPAAVTTNKPGVTTQNTAPFRGGQSPRVIEENWLNGIRPMLMADNTITVITRTAPDELQVVRQSPFAVTSLELVLLSHWLSGTGSAGINPRFLPPPAKITGPGINPKSP